LYDLCTIECFFIWRCRFAL